MGLFMLGGAIAGGTIMIRYYSPQVSFCSKLILAFLAQQRQRHKNTRIGVRAVV